MFPFDDVIMIVIVDGVSVSGCRESTDGISLISGLCDIYHIQWMSITVQIVCNLAPAFAASTTVCGVLDDFLDSYYYHIIITTSKKIMQKDDRIDYTPKPSLSTYHIGGLMHERRNSIANALELRLSCTKPSICKRFPRLLWENMG